MAIPAEDAAFGASVLGSCSNPMVSYYEDYDGDGYGNRLVTSPPGCSPPLHYVSNSGDCDDTNANDHPGETQCQASDPTILTTCSNDGSFVNSVCSNGCAGGQCKSFGTVGTAGMVTCGATVCSTSQGCTTGGGIGWGVHPSCGTSGSNYLSCDGPNDCPGQICCFYRSPGNSDGHASCQANDGSCPSSQMGYTSNVVCDPTSPSCPPGTACSALGPSYMFALYICQ